jgi:hypothetical protein
VVTVKFPKFNPKFNERPIIGAAARAAATIVRQTFRRGLGTNGASLGAGRFRNTGQLIRSIKGQAKQRKGKWVGIVFATGFRGDIGASLRGRNASLLAVLTYGRKNAKNRRRFAGVMSMNPTIKAAATQAAMKRIGKLYDFSK